MGRCARRDGRVWRHLRPEVWFEEWCLPLVGRRLGRMGLAWWAGSRYVGGRMEREAADGTERGYCEVVTSVADVACGYVGKLES